MKPIAAAAIFAGIALSQSVIVNPTGAKWIPEAGSESVTLREDPQTGALEMLVRYPSGHVFRPHWHNSNERMVLIEGRVSLRQGNGGSAASGCGRWRARSRTRGRARPSICMLNRTEWRQ